MKTLRQFLEEAQQVHSFSKTILDNYSQAPFIIRHSVWKKFVPSKPAKIIGWHVTDFSGFENLVKRKGRKNPISTFTVPDWNGDVFGGVETKASVLLALEGNVGWEFAYDAYTARTDSSYRTLLLKSYEWTNFIVKGINKPSVTSVYKKLVDFLVNLVPDWKKTNGLEPNTPSSDLSGIQKRDLIKHYLDSSEAYLIKNSKSLGEMFFSGATFDEEISYNEVILEYPKMMRVFYYGNDKDEESRFIEICSKHKIPHDVFPDYEIKNVFEIWSRVLH